MGCGQLLRKDGVYWANLSASVLHLRHSQRSRLHKVPSQTTHGLGRTAASYRRLDSTVTRISLPALDSQPLADTMA
jgi:hypothetical protein